jgi:hypothetical protein
VLKNSRRSLAESAIQKLRISGVLRRLYPLAISAIYSEESIDFYRQIRKLLIVHEPHLPLIRLGSRHDGGYVLLNDFSEATICISLGIGDNVSFDQEISSRVASIIMCDYSIEKLPMEIENGIFRRIRIGTNKLRNDTSLREILEEVPAGTPIILKMDIEGAEWENLLDATVSDLSRCSQIICEFHGLHDIKSRERFLEVFETFSKLNITHRLVNIHANNWARYDLIGGIPVPEVIECTYILRNDLSKFDKVQKENLLNFPNNPKAHEFELSFMHVNQI